MGHPRPTCDVLVLDAGTRPALVAVRSLGRAGLSVATAECDARWPGVAARSRYAVSALRLPNLETDPDQYVDGVLSAVLRTGAQLVLPVHDGSVAALRKRLPEVLLQVGVALPSTSALDLFEDKSRTQLLARRLGVPTADGSVVEDLDDVEAVVDAAELPVVVKPCRSWVADERWHAQRLVCRAAATREELREALRGVLLAGGTALVQPLLPGRREAVHAVAVDGRVMVCCTQATDRTWPVLGGSSVLRWSIPSDPELGHAAELLLGAVGYTGYAEVEFRRDAGGTPVLMEVNPRLSASVEVAVRSGCDVPLLLWQVHLGAPLASAVPRRQDVRMRWFGGDVRWLVDMLCRPGQVQGVSRTAALTTFGRECLRRSGSDYLGWRDPVPALAALPGFMGTAVRRSRNGLSKEPAAR